MKIKVSFFLIIGLLMTPLAVAQQTETSVSLRQAIPREVHLAVYGRNNPERAYQEEYLAEVWRTFQDEKIAEQIFSAVTSRIPEEKLAQATSMWDQIATALEPIHCEAICHAEEMVYAQAMEAPVTHHLLIVRLSSAEAGEYQRGYEQLLDLVADWSKGKVSKRVRQTEQASFVTLDLPQGVPFRPTLVRSGEVMIFSTSEKLAKQSLSQLFDDDAVSKFDDPRLVEALSELPEAEDAIVFFDARLMFERFHGLADFMRQKNTRDNEQLNRWSQIFDRILDELTILDYEVTVEYTEGQQNRVAVLGKWLPDAEDKLLYQAISQGQPFENWQTWVPADAEAYSLNTGMNLHVVYERVLQFVREEIPESHEALDQLERKQQELGFHLDRDLLQAFSGETVSVTVPVEAADGSTRQCRVTALRCHDPEKIQELLSRGMEVLTALPPVQAQQLKFVECEELEGFQELQGAMLGVFKARPVIGFHDGWMIISSTPDAAARVLATRKGEADAIAQADSFQKFGLEVTGPVYAVSYTDVGAAVKQAADTIDQIGAFAPMVLGMMAANASPDDLQPIQEVIGLLPSLSKVVRKFDFVEHQLSVVREGPRADTYRKERVWLIRAPEETSRVAKEPQIDANEL
jgi:hypothetical protein